MFLSFHSVIIYVWETYNGSGSTDALCYKKTTTTTVFQKWLSYCDFSKQLSLGFTECLYYFKLIGNNSNYHLFQPMYAEEHL